MGQNPGRLTPRPGSHTALPWKLWFSSKDLYVLLLATESSGGFSFWEELACFGDSPTSLFFLCNILHFSLLRVSWESEELNFRATSKLRFNWYILWAVKLMHPLAVLVGPGGKDITYPSLSVCWIWEPPNYTSNFASTLKFSFLFCLNWLRVQTSHGRVWKRSSRSLRRKYRKLGWQK